MQNTFNFPFEAISIHTSEGSFAFLRVPPQTFVSQLFLARLCQGQHGHVPLGQSPEHQEGASRSQLEFNLIFWVWEGHVPGAVWFWEQGLERFNSGLIAVLSPVLVLCPVSCGAMGRAELTSHLMDFCVSCSGDVMGKGTLLTGVQLLL